MVNPVILPATFRSTIDRSASSTTYSRPWSVFRVTTWVRGPLRSHPAASAPWKSCESADWGFSSRLLRKCDFEVRPQFICTWNLKRGQELKTTNWILGTRNASLDQLAQSPADGVESHQFQGHALAFGLHQALELVLKISNSAIHRWYQQTNVGSTKYVKMFIWR